MSKNLLNGDIEFDSPAARIVKQFSEDGTEQFRIPANLPDTTFFRALSIQGRLRYFQAQGTITVTPTVGETFFFYRAEMFNSHASENSTVTISNNGQTRWEMIIPSIAAGVYITAEFIDSLVGNGINTFTLTPVDGTVRASLFGWVENTSRIRDVTI